MLTKSAGGFKQKDKNAKTMLSLEPMRHAVSDSYPPLMSLDQNMSVLVRRAFLEKRI